MTKSFAQASRSRVLKMRPMPTTEDTQSANERKKLIAAILLGTLAMFMIARTFILSPTPNKGRSSARRTSNTAARAAQTAPASPSEVREDPLVPPQPIRYSWPEPTGVAIGRNIFAYYIPPATNRASASQPPLANTPTPTPPPPLILASLSPPSVHARTGEFTLEAFGDKFTPQTRIVFGNNELPTRFISGQQLAATVPAALVVGEGPRQVIVRTPDGKLFSNTLVLNVIPPPTPPFNYIGLIGGRRYNDTAVLQHRENREVLRVQRGDTVGGRFRVTGISERAVELTDTQLGVKHLLRYEETRANIGEATPARPFESSRRPVPPPEQAPLQQPPANSDDEEEKPFERR